MARLIHDDRAGQEFLHHTQVVRGDEHRLRQFAQQVDQPAAGARVKTGGRFIEHQDGRFHRQHRRHRDAFLLAGAQMMRDAGSAMCPMCATASRAAATRSRTSAGRNP